MKLLATALGAAVVALVSTAPVAASVSFTVTNNGTSSYLFDGVPNPTLNLVRGETYIFNVNSPFHPFYIKTSPVTGTGMQYNTGVTGQGVEVGTLTFVVPCNAPGLFYQCSVHAAMSGAINIVDPSLVESPPGAGQFSPGTGTPGSTVTISGANFAGITSVKFNGTAAAFTVNSPFEIEATVPALATPGPISVETACATATACADFFPCADPISAWSHLLSCQTPPSRSGHVSVHHPASNRVYVFGGANGGTRMNDLWSLDVASPTGWLLVIPTGTPPSARTDAAAFYDSPRNRMILVGGFDGTYRNDVWSLSFATNPPTWTQLSPSGTPPAGRSLHSVVYDSARDRMLLFGGFDGTNRRNDCWQLTLGATPAWTVQAPLNPPPARMGQSCVYVPFTDTVVMFGGDNGSPTNEVWTLGSPSVVFLWNQDTPTGTAGMPTARTGHRAVFDATSSRILYWGGTNGVTANNEVWSLNVANPSKTWKPIGIACHSPRALSAASLVHAQAANKLVLFGGANGAPVFDDTWIMSGSLSTVAVEPPAGSSEDADWSRVLPNPGREGASIEFDLATRAQVRLRVFDAAGRTIATLLNGETGAGRHRVRWDALAGGRRAAAGVYYYEITAGERRTTKRFVILE